ncbi:hypothetical protein [Methylobacterium terrae]|nr:hypothetical protein [Methylobacterium terrae]
MSEREFWHFVWLCVRLSFVGMPWWQAVPAAWGAQLLIRRRYLAL